MGGGGGCGKGTSIDSEYISYSFECWFCLLFYMRYPFNFCLFLSFTWSVLSCALMTWNYSWSLLSVWRTANSPSQRTLNFMNNHDVITQLYGNFENVCTLVPNLLYIMINALCFLSPSLIFVSFSACFCLICRSICVHYVSARTNLSATVLSQLLTY